MVPSGSASSPFPNCETAEDGHTVPDDEHEMADDGHVHEMADDGHEHEMADDGHEHEMADDEHEHERADEHIVKEEGEQTGANNKGEVELAVDNLDDECPRVAGYRWNLLESAFNCLAEIRTAVLMKPKAMLWSILEIFLQ